MKALSLTRPWPFAFISGPMEKRKLIENRSWRPPDSMIGEYVFLHSAKSWDEDDREYIARILGIEVPSKKDSLYSVIGVRVRLDGFLVEIDEPLLKQPLATSPRTLALPDDFQIENWFFGPIGWVFSEVKALPNPVECKNAKWPDCLRLWDIPPDVQAKIDEQIA